MGRASIWSSLWCVLVKLVLRENHFCPWKAEKLCGPIVFVWPLTPAAAALSLPLVDLSTAHLLSRWLVHLRWIVFSQSLKFLWIIEAITIFYTDQGDSCEDQSKKQKHRKGSFSSPYCKVRVGAARLNCYCGSLIRIWRHFDNKRHWSLFLVHNIHCWLWEHHLQSGHAHVVLLKAPPTLTLQNTLWAFHLLDEGDRAKGSLTRHVHRNSPLCLVSPPPIRF